MIKAVIIDDEREGRLTLTNMLQSFCQNIEVVAEADSVASGLEVINNHQFDLLFLDIQLQDGNGFEILEKLNRHDFKVIIVTAYDQYALKAIKFSAFDYLLKPVDPEQLVLAVNKFALQRGPETYQEEIKALLANQKRIKTIALPSLEGIRFVKIDQIIRCEAVNNYTRFYTYSGEEILIAKTLKEYDEMLEEMNFCRVHQSHLINLDHVERYVKGGSTVVMSNGSEVEVSRRKKDEFMKRMLNIAG